MFIVGIVWRVSKYRPPVIDNENQYYFIAEGRGVFSKNKSENKILTFSKKNKKNGISVPFFSPFSNLIYEVK